MRRLLPAPLAAAIDWRTLALRSGAHVDKRLRQQFSDLLFTVRLAGRLALLWVVFDHKSRNDPWAGLQLLGYAVGIWKQLLRQKPGPAKLPRIRLRRVFPPSFVWASFCVAKPHTRPTLVKTSAGH